jgi:hypothetical protein
VGFGGEVIMNELTYQLRKCKECSCSRCSFNGTPGCYVDIAIKEIERYEQAMDSIQIPADYLDNH